MTTARDDETQTAVLPNAEAPPAVGIRVDRRVRPLVEDDRPLVTRILQALPEQPPTPYAGWARYRNECADFVDRLRAALAAPEREPSMQERDDWALGDYDNGEHGCPNCGRLRLCLCPNGKRRCEKCNWSPELNDYAPFNE